MTLETITKLIIPISTFFLGMLFTFLLKRYEQRRDDYRVHIKEVGKLINAWYDQPTTNHKRETKDRNRR